MFYLSSPSPSSFYHQKIKAGERSIAGDVTFLNVTGTYVVVGEL